MKVAAAALRVFPAEGKMTFTRRIFKIQKYILPVLKLFFWGGGGAPQKSRACRKLQITAGVNVFSRLAVLFKKCIYIFCLKKDQTHCEGLCVMLAHQPRVHTGQTVQNTVWSAPSKPSTTPRSSITKNKWPNHDVRELFVLPGSKYSV